MGVNLVERYAGYQPPSWVRPTVERLLASLPEGYLSSLGSVTLTDRHSTGKGKTRRVAGRKYDRRACLGFYRRSDRGSASIEVLVDNTLAGLSSSVLLLPFVRDWALGPADDLISPVGPPAPSPQPRSRPEPRIPSPDRKLFFDTHV